MKTQGCTLGFRITPRWGFEVVMNLLVTALFDEAKPFIEASGCKKVSNERKLNFYKDESIGILIAGCGKVAAAIAMARLLERMDLEELGHVINVGTCGASDRKIPLGTIHLINKITDQATGRNYFPDRLCASSFEEGSLISVDAGQTPANAQKDSLYDMEASGIFQAVTQFVTADRVHFLKVVSDHLEPESLTREKVQGWIQPCVPAVLEFMKSLPKNVSNKPLNQWEIEFLEEIEEHWKLTKTQFHQLKDAAIYFNLTNSDEAKLLDLQNLMYEIKPEASDKSSRNQAFANLLNALGT